MSQNNYLQCYSNLHHNKCSEFSLSEKLDWYFYRCFFGINLHGIQVLQRKKCMCCEIVWSVSQDICSVFIHFRIIQYRTFLFKWMTEQNPRSSSLNNCLPIPLYKWLFANKCYYVHRLFRPKETVIDLILIQDFTTTFFFCTLWLTWWKKHCVMLLTSLAPRRNKSRLKSIVTMFPQTFYFTVSHSASELRKQHYFHFTDEGLRQFAKYTGLQPDGPNSPNNWIIHLKAGFWNLYSHSDVGDRVFIW